MALSPLLSCRGGRSRTLLYHDGSVMLFLPVAVASQVPEGRALKQSCALEVVPAAAPYQCDFLLCPLHPPAFNLVTNTQLPDAEVAGVYEGSLALLSSSTFPVDHLSLESCLQALVSSWKLLLSVCLLFAISLHYCWRKNWPSQEAM